MITNMAFGKSLIQNSAPKGGRARLRPNRAARVASALRLIPVHPSGRGYLFDFSINLVFCLPPGIVASS
jgi:hypothetical protein